MQWYWGSFPGITRPGHDDVDHLLPSTAEVKNEWSYAFTSPICFYGVNREHFMFTFTSVLGSTLIDGACECCV